MFIFLSADGVNGEPLYFLPLVRKTKNKNKGECGDL